MIHSATCHLDTRLTPIQITCPPKQLRGRPFLASDKEFLNLFDLDPFTKPIGKL